MDCKHHVVFAPRFGHRLIYGKYRRTIGEILRKPCENKGIESRSKRVCGADPYVRQDDAQVRVLEKKEQYDGSE